MKFLIVSADDFGLGDNRDEAIKILLKDKCISSTSVMVNQLNAIKVIDYINKKDLKSCGIHLTLSSGHSIFSPDRQLDFNLNDKNNYLKLVTNYKFYQREIKSQIDFATNSWNVSHLDGHLHIHSCPLFYQTITKNMKKNRLGKIRSSFTSFEKDNALKVQFRNLYRNIMKKNRFIMTDYFFDISYFMKNVNSVLNLPSNSIIEIMCHPNINYNEDFEILTSSEYRKLISRFELISYNELIEYS